MTNAQLELERLKVVVAREEELRILGDAMRFADPNYVQTATGFWLDCWQGKRRGEVRTHLALCPPTTPTPTTSTSSSVVNSDCSL
jgi:hypothetical protein